MEGLYICMEYYSIILICYEYFDLINDCALILIFYECSHKAFLWLQCTYRHRFAFRQANFCVHMSLFFREEMGYLSKSYAAVHSDMAILR